MSEQAIRFSVHGGPGHQAATWKCWTPGGKKNDIYLACRALHGELKASLHESGEWHVAFSASFFGKAFAESAPRPATRFVDSWPRPRPLMPGVTLAFRVLTPWSSITSTVEKVDSRVILLPAPPEGQAVEVAVAITSSPYASSTWPGRQTMGTKLVGSLALPCGDTVWLVHRNTPFSLQAPPRAQGSFFEGVDRTALESSGLRAIVFGSEPDGSRVMYDMRVVVSQKGAGQ